MTLYECRACHGVFEEVLRDGARYFHACPPVANVSYQPDPHKDAYDPRETVERQGHRDENSSGVPRPPGDESDEAREARMKAPGAGRERLGAAEP